MSRFFLNIYCFLFCLVILGNSPVYANSEGSYGIQTIEMEQTLSVQRFSKKQFGNAFYSAWLREMNPQMKSKVEKGQSIHIPSVQDYTVQRGDTLAKVAARFLGDPQRYIFLMANAPVPEFPNVEPGLRLKIPAQIQLEKIPDQTVSQLSEQFFAEPYGGEILLAYNRVDRNANQSLSISEILASEHQAASNLELPFFEFLEKSGKGGSLQPRRGSPFLTQAIQNFKDGHFVKARHYLERAQKVPWNSFFEMALIERYLAFISIAEGDIDRAKQHFRKAKVLDPGIKLNNHGTSPKILSIWSEIR